MGITNISKSNKALHFIEMRISSDDYRGLHLFQHYRYDLNFIKTVLQLLDSHERETGNKYLQIRTSDTSRRPENVPEEIPYSDIVSEIKSMTGKGTQDVIRKIVFIDCDRMGFLHRYDRKRKVIPPNSGPGRAHYVSLSERGKSLVEAKDLKAEYFIFSAGLYRIVGPLIKTLETLIVDHGLGHISKYEFMYFVSAVDDQSSFSIGVDECASLVKEFRLLGEIQKKAVTAALQAEMKPENYKGDKKDKRDFANWDNEATQIFLLLSTTVYFEVRNRIKLILNQSDTSLDSIIGEEYKKTRSLHQKTEYYRKHGVESKISGFELHHIVALENADSPALYKLLDDWKNMAYIDGFNHARITQNRNRNIILDFQGEDVVLADHDANKILLKYRENIAYNPEMQGEMGSYNHQLLTVINASV